MTCAETIMRAGKLGGFVKSVLDDVRDRIERVELVEEEEEEDESEEDEEDDEGVALAVRLLSVISLDVEY